MGGPHRLEQVARCQPGPAESLRVHVRHRHPPVGRVPVAPAPSCGRLVVRHEKIGIAVGRGHRNLGLSSSSILPGYAPGHSVPVFPVKVGLDRANERFARQKPDRGRDRLTMPHAVHHILILNRGSDPEVPGKRPSIEEGPVLAPEVVLWTQPPEEDPGANRRSRPAPRPTPAPAPWAAGHEAAGETTRADMDTPAGHGWSRHLGLAVTDPARPPWDPVPAP